MTTRIDEIADGIYRISTLVKEVSPPVGFTFNQFLIMADAPMLFHCGHHKMFPAIAEAVAKVMPLDRLRWLGFSHVEADECGALNDWLAAAPNATAVIPRYDPAIGAALLAFADAELPVPERIVEG